MGLKEVAEELKAQIAEAEKVEENEPEVEVKAEPKAEEVKEDPKDDEKPEDKPEEKPVEAAKTNADYARERKEAARVRKENLELADARARIAELEANAVKKTEVAASDPEPVKADDPQAHVEWQLRQTQKELKETREQVKEVVKETAEDRRIKQTNELKNQAVREVANFESEVRQANPDFDDVRNFYQNVLAVSIKRVNPKITNDKLIEAVNNRMLSRASEFLNDGHANPIQAMYEEGKSWGWQPKAKEEPEAKEIKPDLAKVAANRARNAGTAGAQGKGSDGDLTPKVAATLTNREFAKLKPEEKKRMFEQLGAMG